MELDVLSTKLDDMKAACGERMGQLEKNLTLSIAAQNTLLANRIAVLEETSKAQGKAIDRLKEWKNIQIGALIILGIIVEQIIARIPWKW